VIHRVTIIVGGRVQACWEKLRRVEKRACDFEQHSMLSMIDRLYISGASRSKTLPYGQDRKVHVIRVSPGVIITLPF